MRIMINNENATGWSSPGVHVYCDYNIADDFIR